MSSNAYRDKMVEAMARAMVRKSTGTTDPDKLVPVPRGKVGLAPLWRSYERLATAALDAALGVLAEPSAEMVRAGGEAHDELWIMSTRDSRQDSAHIFAAMLATLGEA